MFVQGRLFMQDNQRWCIRHYSGGGSTELSCGSVIYVLIVNSWVPTCIEHNGREYYATTKGIRLENDLPARIGNPPPDEPAVEGDW